MGKKKTPKHYWNHRIITTWCNGLGDSPGERLFSIVEVHYDDGKPVGFGDKNILQGHVDIKDLKWTLKKIKKVFRKPILDADNHLKKWKKDKK